MKEREFIFVIKGLPENHILAPWPRTNFIYDEGKHFLIIRRKQDSQRMRAALQRRYQAEPFTGVLPTKITNYRRGVIVTINADGSSTCKMASKEEILAHYENEK